MLKEFQKLINEINTALAPVLVNNSEEIINIYLARKGFKAKLHPDVYSEDEMLKFIPTLIELNNALIDHLKNNGYTIRSKSDFKKSNIELAKDYAAAELLHATQGPASEADSAARLAICMACEHRAVEYKGQTDAGGVGWCTKCGCGNNPRAMLTVKVTLAGVQCPLAKWGKVEGTGASVASAVDAVAGVAKSIIHKLGGG